MPKDQTEAALRVFLDDHKITYQAQYEIQGLCGKWRTDFFIKGQKPIVIEVKGATKSGKESSVVPIQAKEAFTMFYDIKMHSDLPKNTTFVLVHGDAPLKTRNMDFTKILEALGVIIIPFWDKKKILSIIKCK